MDILALELVEVKLSPLPKENQSDIRVSLEIGFVKNLIERPIVLTGINKRVV